jgi:hypothetical protein
VSGCSGARARALAKCSLIPSNVSFRPTKSFQPATASRYVDSVPVAYPGICERLRYAPSCSSPCSSEVVGMSKSKFTEADVRRAVKGVFDGGGRVSSVEIWPDGRISVIVKEDKHRSIDPEDDPEVSRRLL